MRSLRNIPASVRTRLTNRAKARGEDVQLTLLRYTIERLLYRLSRSEYADRFVLKGAMLLNVWADALYRSTSDLDLLGYGDSAAYRLAGIFQAVCATDVEPDGVEFLADTVRASQARESEEYQGVRVTLEARIAGARLSVQVDIGFGDAVVPGPWSTEYPALLEFPAPQLRAYPRESVVAEKFHAMVQYAELTSRMKDFYDLWAIATIFDFQGPVLAEAIRATFERRQTRLPLETPAALAPEFALNPMKQDQWQKFLQWTTITMAPEPFPIVLAKVHEFMMPPTTAITKGVIFEETWPAGGPWRAR